MFNPPTLLKEKYLPVLHLPAGPVLQTGEEDRILILSLVAQIVLNLQQLLLLGYSVHDRLVMEGVFGYPHAGLQGAGGQREEEGGEDQQQGQEA